MPSLEARVLKLEEPELPDDAPLLGHPFTLEQERYFRARKIPYGVFRIINANNLLLDEEVDHDETPI